MFLFLKESSRHSKWALQYLVKPELVYRKLPKPPQYIEYKFILLIITDKTGVSPRSLRIISNEIDNNSKFERNDGVIISPH